MSVLKIGYAVGVFDLFHYGHQNLILESIKRCDKIIVGVHTDKFVESYKRKPKFKFFLSYRTQGRFVR